jgi:peptidyl-dipeptidase A
MSLELQELEEGWLFDTLDALENLTGDSFKAWKRMLDGKLSERFGTGTLYPWHYADPFFQSPPPEGKVDLDSALGESSAAVLAQETFSLWGIDLRGVLDRSDLYPRRNKSQHAFCLSVDRSGDVRILANIVPGERWVEVMLHESGHAAYDISIDAGVPYLLRRPAHTFVTEAIAILCGRLVRNGRWLTEVAGVPRDGLDAVQSRLAGSTAANSLLFARWGLVMVHFERDLYADPEADLDSRWWELVQRFQLVTPPPHPRAGQWAAKIHVASAPVYYQNYLLGEILASQLERVCERECGGLVAVRDAGRLLVDRVFRHGALVRWDSLIEQATGATLSATDFAEALAA